MRASARAKGLGHGLARRSLGRRLLLWFVLISLVPLLVSNAWGYLRSEVIIEGLVERYLSGIADLQARQIAEGLRGLERGLELLGDHPVISRTLTGEVSVDAVGDYLDEALGETPDLDALYLFDRSGRMIASAPLPPADLAPWIGPPLTPPHPRFEVRRTESPPHYPYVRIAVPVSGDTSSGYHLGATVALGEGQSFLQLPEHTAGSVETLVLDSDRRPVFVSHPHGHIDYGLPVSTPAPVSAADRRITAYRDRTGVPVLGTARSIPDRDWMLVNEVPESDALLELRRLRSVSLWLAAFLALLVLTAGWVTARRIAAPVRGLVSATRRLGAGDLSARAEVGGDEEIRSLGASFNRMAEELERTSARVEELHRRELERAAQLATVGELAAGVAHEIKNPIAAIKGGLDLVGKRVPDDEELHRILDEMRRQSGRVDGALRDLLRFARPVDPTLVPTDVNAVVRRVRTLVAAAAEGAEVSLEAELADDLPVIPADPELLGQCLVNLVMNGIQATPAGGRVRIRTSAQGDGVTLKVADSGEGIAPARRDRIFRPFFTTKHRGTGLGLSITAGIVTSHGGRISIDSEPGAGATFTVWLPRAGPPDSESDDDSRTTP